MSVKPDERRADSHDMTDVAMPHSHPRLRILYFAVQVPTYPRNSRVRAFLVDELKADVEVVQLSPRPGYLRHLGELLRDARRIPGPLDFVILSELSITMAPLSWLIARRYRARHVVDFFVGLRETHIEDRRKVRRTSIRGVSLVAIEWLAAKSADALLIDTDVRRRFLEKRYRRSAITLPVGAPIWAAMAPPPPTNSSKRPRLLYYGNYIPLHGVGQLVSALALLAMTRDFEVTMIGDGDDRALAEREVARLGLGSRVSFLEPVSESILAQQIRSHDIVLGIFGTSPKAASVIANKVWQGLYASRIVVTRDSEALDEIRAMVGGQLVTAEGESPELICAALQEALDSYANQGQSADVAPSETLEAYVRTRYGRLGAWLSSERPKRRRRP